MKIGKKVLIWLLGFGAVAFVVGAILLRGAEKVPKVQLRVVGQSELNGKRIIMFRGDVTEKRWFQLVAV